MTTDTTSPAGSWRAAIDPDSTCAVCKQRVCEHSDVEFQGIVPDVKKDLKHEAHR